MKKYCRYCSFCILGDWYYCTIKEKQLRRVDRAVKCDDFALSELGDVETGRQYKPRCRPRKMSAKTEMQQISMFENNENETR